MAKDTDTRFFRNNVQPLLNNGGLVRRAAAFRSDSLVAALARDDGADNDACASLANEFIHSFIYLPLI